MKTVWKVWLVSAVVLVGMAGTALAVEKKTGDTKRPTYYVVVKAVSVHNEVTFEAIPTDSYLERRKECPKHFKDAREQWDQDRKEARSKHQKFTEKPPVMPSITKVSNTFKKEEEAQAFATKLQERWDASHNKGKEGSKAGKDNEGKAKGGEG